MSQKRLTAAIDRRFRALNRRERITRIRELAGESPEDERFIQKTFQELHREGFPAKRYAKNSD
jgi:DNA-binding transcriptional regulator YhcF (GntR family)